MANSDYKKGGKGNFASVVAWPEGLGRDDTLIAYLAANVAIPIEAGMTGMVDDEIVRIESVDPDTGEITIKRGCADTIPAEHEVGALMWVLNVAAMGTDGVERSAGEIIGVKVSPYTAGGGTLDPETVAPLAVEFDFRWLRPYAPGQMRVNGERWYDLAIMDDTTPLMNFTWVHRDRVLQSDQLVGHDDASVGPEPGTTYTLRIYNALTDELLRTEAGIIGMDFTYPRALALYDLDYPVASTAGYYTFASNRDAMESRANYLGDFAVVPGGAHEVSYLAFAEWVIESPYIINLHSSAGSAGGIYAVAIAARPADRTIDTYDLWSNQIVSEEYTKLVDSQSFTPWLSIDFRLPELETIVNIRSSSLYDGVPIDEPPVVVGQLALIDDELVQITSIGPKQFVIKRGCADTIPAVHIAGTRMWLLEARASFDSHLREVDVTVDYRFVPDNHADVDLNPDAMPQHLLPMVGRAMMPYPPARLMVNLRPWFEEAQALVGEDTLISWVRRNRVTQGGTVVDHGGPDYAMEVGQDTHLLFFYYMPSTTPGDPPVVNVLREISSAGTSYAYSYADAVEDGGIAGTAQGVCGTVVIYCRIYATRGALASLQSYLAPIRVPSYPC